MCILYELGLIIARIITPRETAAGDAIGNAVMERAEDSRRAD
jgi:Sec-independent protein secretion pathway component TatC